MSRALRWDSAPGSHNPPSDAYFNMKGTVTRHLPSISSYHFSYYWPSLSLELPVWSLQAFDFVTFDIVQIFSNGVITNGVLKFYMRQIHIRDENWAGGALRQRLWAPPRVSGLVNIVGGPRTCISDKFMAILRQLALGSHLEYHRPIGILWGEGFLSRYNNALKMLRTGILQAHHIICS